ncbi:MAG: valine--tRNA ligase [Candidatus Aenigmarchaeota archaeon]|nr:valine--tRNA ligase [Candidatus Aenigmarchaeota archaeon]
MQKKYKPKEVEPRIIKFWEEQKIFAFDKNSKKPIFSVDTPPPTISGEMHIGHACSYSQQDFIIRFKRMNGFNVFYPFGTDNNGLPTERLVEKKKKIRARDMERNQFIKICNEFLKIERPKFIQDWKNIGVSCDFSLEYSTIDEHSRKISQWSFIDLFKKERVYRKDAPSMWCPECKTGVAQVEVQDKEMDSTFNDIIFKVDDNDIIISTTRPELLSACVCIFYNPEDERFKHLKGKMAKVPLFDFKVPIMEDERADPEKGTGLVMCCTFGDQTDMEWQKAHNLPIKMALNPEGTMTDISGKYVGMRIKVARKTIIEDLREAGLLLSQKPIKHAVNVHERCGTEIEFIKSKQWFVKYLDLKDDMLKWGEELNWYPEYMKHRYSNWVKGLQWDWLISNQRYFGVAFPVWYCSDCGEVILADEKDLPVEPLKDKPPFDKCPKCKSNKIEPEKDVLNTWFTSSMTPQIAAKLMDEETQKKLFPMDLRPQAHDIITFWLFNTVVKSRLHFQKNPWKDTIISGFVTLKGEKMSKSKGNVIKPQDVLKNHSADALRFWSASAKLGSDLPYNEKDVVTGQKTVTKLWNASKFVGQFISDIEKPKLEIIDIWLLSKLNSLIEKNTSSFNNYEYADAKREIENFFWHTFCDNYLEMVKHRAYDDDNSAKYTLYQALIRILKLFAPIMPFVTEEIYQNMFKENEKDKSIHISSWPVVEKDLIDDEIESTGDLAVAIISAVRQYKSTNSLALNSEVNKLVIESNDEETKQKIGLVLDDIKGTMNIKEIEFGTGEIDVEGYKIKIKII